MNLHVALSIGEVAAATGLSVSTLRAWEQRYGFPRPLRLPSGHRRYDPETVTIVERVVALRRDGMSIGAAFEAVGVTGGSLVASISALMPPARPARLSRSGMLAVSQAIEDEAVETQRRPVLFGAFQRPAVWEQTAARWTHLATHTRATIAMAPGLAHGHAGRLRTIDLPATWALAEEWAVISDGSPMACLVGAELNDGSGDFRAFWSTHPVAVRHVSSAVWRSIRISFPRRIRDPLDVRLDAVPDRGSAVMAQSVALSSRIVEYLDRPSRQA